MQFTTRQQEMAQVCLCHLTLLLSKQSAMLQVHVHANPLRLIVPVAIKISLISFQDRSKRYDWCDCVISTFNRQDSQSCCRYMCMQTLIVPITIKIFPSLAPRTGQKGIWLVWLCHLGLQSARQSVMLQVCVHANPLQLIVPSFNVCNMYVLLCIALSNVKRIVQQHRERKRKLHECDGAGEVIDLDVLSTEPAVEPKNGYHPWLWKTKRICCQEAGCPTL